MNDPIKPDPDLEPIVARLDAVHALVERIKEEIGPNAVRSAEGIITRHRPGVYAEMDALGLAIQEFMVQQPAPERREAMRAFVARKLQDWAMSSPVTLYGSQRGQRRLAYFELVEQIRERRPAGADVPARVFHDYFVHTRISDAFINRLELLPIRLAHEISLARAAGQRPLTLFCLQYLGGEELLPLVEDRAVFADLQVTLIDSTAAAVRHAEHKLRGIFKNRGQFAMADPERWLMGPASRADSVCVAYATSLLEQIDPRRAVRLISAVHRVLQPGGVFIMGCTPGTPPLGELMVRECVLGSAWLYRREAEWRALFAESPFFDEHITFEWEPLGINALIRAEKAS